MDKKIYLMIGLSGHGKSTLGNCIINQSGELQHVTQLPFVTSDSANGCTKEFQCKENSQYAIIDTIGFADPKIEQEKIIADFKKALNHFNFKIDCIFFVLKGGRITKEIVDFFALIKHDLLLDKCGGNSILIITGVKPGWINEPEQKKNTILQTIVEGCNSILYEFSLRLDHYNDDPDDIKKNITKRKTTIDALIKFLNSKTFERVELEHLKDITFWENFKPKLTIFIGVYLAAAAFSVAPVVAGMSFIGLVYNAVAKKKE